MGRKSALLALLILVSATAAAFAQQQTPPAGPPHPGPMMGPRQGPAPGPGPGWGPPWFRMLTPEQRSVFEKIYETRTKTIFPLVMQLRASEAQLLADLAQQNVNSQAVDQALKQINGLQAQIARAQVDMMLEVKKQLPQFAQHFMMRFPGMINELGCGMMGGHGLEGRHGEGMERGHMGHGMMGGGWGDGMAGPQMGDAD